MYELRHDPEICARCDTVDCLTRCQYIKLDAAAAKAERKLLLEGKDSRVLHECVTCYACEEYCPQNNHPFYLIVERQEEREVWPAPIPITRQQVAMMAPRGQLAAQKISAPIIDMCYFPMLTGTVRGKLFEGASTIAGSDIFCNIMWLHFAKNSVIRERLPRMIENIMKYYLEPSGVHELVCFHDECYGAYTQLAPAFGIEVPFKSVHLFEYLARRLAELKNEIKPLNAIAAYQRPCSNRLVPETQPWADEIFKRIGVTHSVREYDGQNALCCAMILRAQQRFELADELQRKNVADMKAAGAQYAVFNCPMCYVTLGEAAREQGMTPIMMSDLCQLALGAGIWG